MLIPLNAHIWPTPDVSPVAIERNTNENSCETESQFVSDSTERSSAIEEEVKILFSL